MKPQGLLENINRVMALAAFRRISRGGATAEQLTEYENCLNYIDACLDRWSLHPRSNIKGADAAIKALAVLYATARSHNSKPSWRGWRPSKCTP